MNITPTDLDNILSKENKKQCNTGVVAGLFDFTNYRRDMNPEIKMLVENIKKQIPLDTITIEKLKSVDVTQLSNKELLQLGALVIAWETETINEFGLHNPVHKFTKPNAYSCHEICYNIMNEFTSRLESSEDDFDSPISDLMSSTRISPSDIKLLSFLNMFSWQLYKFKEMCAL